MKHILFVCSQNRLRSPTAEKVFSEWPGVETMSAGVNNDAETPVSLDLIEWADVIAVMEDMHKEKLNRRFGAHLADKRVIVLGIPDRFVYMQPELVKLLKTKVLLAVNLQDEDT